VGGVGAAARALSTPGRRCGGSCAGHRYPWGIASSRDTPVIGICAALERARWAVWDLPAALVPMNYVEHVQRAGGLALLIPPDPALTADPGRALERVDALMLIGGPDVDATLYGEAPHPLAEPPAELRDAVEIALLREAAGRGMPVLGICRGMQVLNVAAGGTLRQHLPDDLGHERHRRALGRFAGNEHHVRVEPGSRAREAAGEDRHRVASHHHQGIGAVGARLTVSGRAEEDGVPEALESADGAWVLGVQWHPEADPASGVIAALVREARRARSAGADRREGEAPPIPATRDGERG
jgi:putative glutamine amidotransferase